MLYEVLGNFAVVIKGIEFRCEWIKSGKYHQVSTIVMKGDDTQIDGQRTFTKQDVAFTYFKTAITNLMAE